MKERVERWGIWRRKGTSMKTKRRWINETASKERVNKRRKLTASHTTT